MIGGKELQFSWEFLGQDGSKFVLSLVDLDQAWSLGGDQRWNGCAKVQRCRACERKSLEIFFCINVSQIIEC